MSEVPCSAAVVLQGNLSILVAREVSSLTRARVTVCCTAMSGAGVTATLQRNVIAGKVIMLLTLYIRIFLDRYS